MLNNYIQRFDFRKENLGFYFLNTIIKQNNNLKKKKKFFYYYSNLFSNTLMYHTIIGTDFDKSLDYYDNVKTLFKQIKFSYRLKYICSLNLNLLFLLNYITYGYSILNIKIDDLNVYVLLNSFFSNFLLNTKICITKKKFNVSNSNLYVSRFIINNFLKKIKKNNIKMLNFYFKNKDYLITKHVLLFLKINLFSNCYFFFKNSSLEDLFYFIKKKNYFFLKLNFFYYYFYRNLCNFFYSCKNIFLNSINETVNLVNYLSVSSNNVELNYYFSYDIFNFIFDDRIFFFEIEKLDLYFFIKKNFIFDDEKRKNNIIFFFYSLNYEEAFLYDKKLIHKEYKNNAYAFTKKKIDDDNLFVQYVNNSISDDYNLNKNFINRDKFNYNLKHKKPETCVKIYTLKNNFSYINRKIKTTCLHKNFKKSNYDIDINKYNYKRCNNVKQQIYENIMQLDNCILKNYKSNNNTYKFLYNTPVSQWVLKSNIQTLRDTFIKIGNLVIDVMHLKIKIFYFYLRIFYNLNSFSFFNFYSSYTLLLENAIMSKFYKIDIVQSKLFSYKLNLLPSSNLEEIFYSTLLFFIIIKKITKLFFAYSLSKKVFSLRKNKILYRKYTLIKKYILKKKCIKVQEKSFLKELNLFKQNWVILFKNNKKKLLNNFLIDFCFDIETYDIINTNNITFHDFLHDILYIYICYNHFLKKKNLKKKFNYISKKILFLKNKIKSKLQFILEITKSNGHYYFLKNNNVKNIFECFTKNMLKKNVNINNYYVTYNFNLKNNNNLINSEIFNYNKILVKLKNNNIVKSNIFKHNTLQQNSFDEFTYDDTLSFIENNFCFNKLFLEQHDIQNVYSTIKRQTDLLKYFFVYENKYWRPLAPTVYLASKSELTFNFFLAKSKIFVNQKKKMISKINFIFIEDKNRIYSPYKYLKSFFRFRKDFFFIQNIIVFFKFALFSKNNNLKLLYARLYKMFGKNLKNSILKIKKKENNLLYDRDVVYDKFFNIKKKRK